MKKLENIDQFMDKLSEHNPSFEEGFADNLIQKIENDHKVSDDSYPVFISLFRWVALSGVAAIIILLITIYINTGTMDTDALYGLFNYSPNNPEFASLNY